ncbi:hypothetical protein F4777DRAFT_537979 [Nemania sp. FL0916]|nr:hypothetical protein F4777DRAFT_537979 [Nemania sp. FL0916]
MRSIAPLAVALPLALAVPLEPRDGPEFVLTGLAGTFPYPYPPYGDYSVNSKLVISVTYPDPSSTTGPPLNTTCSVGWPEGIDPAPTGWTPCAAPSLEFRLPAYGYTSDTNFTLELWETTSSTGSGLFGSQILRSNPGNPSDPYGYLFCIQKGKFNPLTCDLTGPLGQGSGRVTIPAVEEAVIPA